MIAATALEGIPEVHAGDDPAELIATSLDHQPLSEDDVLVVAHKLISKAEGRTRRLSEVEPGVRAIDLAQQLEKDPRLVQVVLDDTREVRRAEHGILITVTHQGFVCANAGVDASNAPDDDTVIMLPLDPDASARRLRAGLARLTGARPAVLVTDSFGRAWRTGQCDVAVGCAGLTALDDWRGRSDIRGRELRATVIAVADQLAAAADLARAKDAMQPAVVVRGAGRWVTTDDGPGVAPLLRDPEHDLFR
jgi:coenzyme F420-0:L-glutamate ligase / coenzyme F420-1:gamma-L-glutamate ligase